MDDILSNNTLYVENFFVDVEKTEILNWLNNKSFKIGKNNDGSIIKRTQLWYQKENQPFNKGWEKFDRWRSDTEYDPLLNKMEDTLKLYFRDNNMDLDININSCLINKYRDGEDFIKFHQDSKVAFGNNHYIILLSFGETRTLRFRDKINNDIYYDKILRPNSLLVVYPDINIHYEHSIIKDDSKNTRYSFTFREFINHT
jgi:alkylated DNA repair dioxygenase AlkB